MKRILALLLFASIAFSCEKEYYTTIPYVPVYIDIRLDNRDFELNTNLAYKIIDQPRIGLESGKLGFGGILVINGMGENPVNLFAYDLACPVEAQRNIRIVPDNSSSQTSTVKTAVTATCPKCGAVYTIVTGTGAPQSGTKYYLKSYRIIGNGMQYVVTN